MSGFGYDYCTHPDLSGRKPKYHPCDTLGHANPSADARCDQSGRVLGNWEGAYSEAALQMGMMAPFIAPAGIAGAEAESAFGTTEFGNAVHEQFEQVLTEQTGTQEADWIMKTSPGQTGVDATYVGPASRYPGFSYAELKPMGSSSTAVGNQISNWGLPQGQPSIWWYNRNGVIGQTLGRW